MTQENLADFISSVSGDAHLAVEENLGGGYVRLKTAEAERRQAKHDIRSVEDIVIEMLRNARDAQAKNIYVAISREGSVKTLVFLDDGIGIPKDLQDKIFEPRVTSKLDSMVMDRWGVHGRGMALYSIKCNTSEARVVCSAPGLGSSFIVMADLDALPEKADQSTMPTLTREESGELAVSRGPHNIARTLIEFALESRDRVKVYLGTPTDISAALVANGRRKLTTEELLFSESSECLPVCSRLAAAGDAAELISLCAGLGIPISERTAHRIMAGQIAPAEPALSKLLKTVERPAKPFDLYRDHRGLKVSKEDLANFTQKMEDAFNELAQQYYLDLNGTPKVRVGKDSITVKFSISKEL